MKIKIQIWQIPFNSQAKNIKFQDYETYKKSFGETVQKAHYEKVYDGTIEIYHNENPLEDIYETFNLYHPDDFHGHSLSISDVVNFSKKNYYCNSFGWKEIEFK